MPEYNLLCRGGTIVLTAAALATTVQAETARAHGTSLPGSRLATAIQQATTAER